jgi:uncharacterized protein (UPF0333 family)
MKGIFLFVIFSLLVSPVFSQVSVGITAGYSIAKFKEDSKMTAPTITNSFISTWHAGVIAETKIAGRLYFQPQLLLSKKGNKYELVYKENDVYNRQETHLTYLELPLNVVYKFNGLYVGAGPYIARALKGTYDNYMTYVQPEDGTVHETSYKADIEISSHPKRLEDANPLYYRPMNYGVNFLAGYELKNGWFVNVNYSLGLTDNYVDKVGQYNRTGGVSVGYFFGKGK